MEEHYETTTSREEQEEALVALIEHRTHEVKNIRNRIAYYQSQLEEAEKRLQDSESKLARLRGPANGVSSRKHSSDNGVNNPVKIERRSKSPVDRNAGSSKNQNHYKHELAVDRNGGSSKSQNHYKPELAVGRNEGSSKSQNHYKPELSVDRNGGSSKSQNQSKPELVIPAVAPKVSLLTMLQKSSAKGSLSSGSEAGGGGKADKSHARVSSEQQNTEASGGGKDVGPHARVSSEQQNTEVKDRPAKRKFEEKEHKELIPLICKSSSPSLVHCSTSNHISGQHKRKLRCIASCPVNDQLFVTSALDGMVNMWQVQAKGSGASRLSSTDCASLKERRWAEDITWHPEGHSLFSVYSADGGDSQVSVTNLNKGKGGDRVKFLEDKPHVKGIINNIVFMPWEETCFVTGGSDHAVVLWSEQDGENKWKPKALHRGLHTSAVMGVAGIQHKQIVLSAGADRRIFGFNVHVGRSDFKHQVDSKCMSVLPNPRDFNLFMVQTGTHEKQLRLCDIRLRQTEIHAFGWKQESSDSQSALINQTWSPDGLYIASGSVDPVIHIFDIRYNAHKPSQSIRAHQKRVLKALWLQSLLISISSDLNIGLHKVY